MKHILRSARLLSTLLGLSIACVASAHAAEGDMVRLSQHRLADLGYYSGTFDGLMGPVTSAAIEDFQVSNGLPVSGALTAATYNLLLSMDYRLYNGTGAKMYVNNGWGYQQPVVVHYADGSTAMATRYVTPHVTHVAYYSNSYAMPVEAVAATYVDGATGAAMVSYGDGCFDGAYHRNWHYGDCR